MKPLKAIEMFKSLGYEVIENNLDKDVTKHNPYIRYKNEDTQTRITFEHYKGVDVNVFSYGSMNPTNLTTLHSTLIKAIAKQIEEIEKGN